MSVTPFEHRFSQSVQGSTSRSPLPPLQSSWSLPDPRASTTASSYPSVLRGPCPLPFPFAPPHQIAPPPGLSMGEAPDPEVYAKAYEMLKQRWEGREHELAMDERVEQHRKRRLEETLLRTRGPSRRGSLFSGSGSKETDSVLNQSIGRVEKEEEEDVKPLKRSKTSEDNLISFFDNPPPAASPFDDDGFRRPILPAPRRSQSLSPRLPSSSTRSSSAIARSIPLNPRKRSFSQPCERRLSSFPTAHPCPVEPLRASKPSTSSLSHSRSAPHLSALASPSSSRSEALLHVVKSFEAVLACRAEGWRRLANRKSSASNWTLPPPAPSPSL